MRWLLPLLSTGVMLGCAEDAASAAKAPPLRMPAVAVTLVVPASAGYAVPPRRGGCGVARQC